ncbi:MAG: flippase-like domain-containing protein [Anaerolineales bacterium]|nr:flippase-like domain-containing protein [Anaerolineales bacterium]
MKRWQFWVGLLISLLFLVFYLLPQQDWAKLWESLRSAQYLWLIPAIATYFIGVWFRAERLHYMMRPIKQVPARTLFPIVCIGYMGNNIYPARMGEILRAYVIKQKEGVSISASLAIVLIERIFDAVVMMLFIFVNLPELAKKGSVESGVGGTIQDVAIIGTVLFFGALLVFMLAAMFPAVTSRFVAWAIGHMVPARFRPKVEGIAGKFLEGLACLRSPRDALMILATSIVIWLFEVGKYWFLMHGFAFTVSFFALMLMNGIANIITSIPAAPGYIGTFEAAGVAALQAYNVGKEVATAYTVVLHAALWLPITLLGAYYMLRMGLSVKTVREEVKEETKAE